MLLRCRYRNNAAATGDSIHTCAALAAGTTLLTVGFPAADKMLRYTPVIVCHTTSTGNKLGHSIDTASRQVGHSTWPMLTVTAAQKSGLSLFNVNVQIIIPPKQHKHDRISCQIRYVDMNVSSKRTMYTRYTVSFISQDRTDKNDKRYTYQSPSHWSHSNRYCLNLMNCCYWHWVVLLALLKHWHWLKTSSTMNALF